MAAGWDTELQLRCRKTGKSKMVDVCTWPVVADCRSERSDIIHTIIQHQRADLLEQIKKWGWDPNELLIQPKFNAEKSASSACRCRNDGTSALRECVWNLWTEGVKLCLDAGADPNFNPEHWTKPLNPLELAVHREKTKMVKYLLEKGADPNIMSREDRGLAIVNAIINCVEHGYDTRITELLFEHGSKVNAKNSMHHIISGLEHNIERICDRSEAIDDNEERQRHITEQVAEVQKDSALLFELIVKHGPDVTVWNGSNTDDILYRLLKLQFYNSDIQRLGVFYQRHMDLIYRYGGYTDEEDLLDDEFDTGTHSNILRWLIRHGADTTDLKPSVFVEYLYPELGDDIKFERMNEIPLILAQSGNRVPENVRSFLAELDKVIGKPYALDEDTADALHDEVCLRMKSFLDYHKADTNRFDKPVPSLEQRLHQIADLEEFSDASLNVYPKFDCYIDLNGDPRDMLHNTQSILLKVLDFVSQPLSLQWWCRHYLRKCLVSLHPSVVKTLPGPARLKRYVLCHDI